jgi:hypothetical protein
VRGLYSQLIATTDPEEHARIVLARVADAVDEALTPDAKGMTNVRAVSPLLGKLSEAAEAWRAAAEAKSGRVDLTADPRSLALRCLQPEAVRRALLAIGAGAAEADSVLAPLEALLARVRDRERGEGAPWPD